MIYVAASSKEIERAEKAMRQLRENGIPVSSTWPEQIRKVGAANPIDAKMNMRAIWAYRCLNEIAVSQIFWLLFPTQPTQGAWVELGYALRCVGDQTSTLFPSDPPAAAFSGPSTIVVSGNVGGAIFPALATIVDTDERAFQMIDQTWFAMKKAHAETLTRRASI